MSHSPWADAHATPALGLPVSPGQPAAAEPGFNPAAEPPAHTALQRLDIRFTGSGSEYFRLWIVNLLLTLVTLSLYRPFAKVRRLQYFYSNTLVGGHALGFHGNPWAMLRGHLLLLVFGGAYVLAGQASPLAGAVAGLALAGLWPALWQLGLRFRLANTSWRGLRLQFMGSAGGAYRALAPAMVLAGLVLAGTAAQTGVSADRPASDGQQLAAGLSGLAMLVGSLGLPWLLARLRRYQHGSYQFADQRTQLDVPTSRFYGVFMRASLMGVVPVALVGVVAAIWLPAHLAERAARGAGGHVPWLAIASLAMLYLLAVLWTQAYLGARLQDLVWGHTRAPRLRFRSALSATRLGLLMAKNLLLSVLTLGLYQPFAAVAMARLRMQALHLEVVGDVGRWSSPLHSGGTEATGDAAGDLLDIDLGL